MMDSAIATAAFVEILCFLFFILFLATYIPALRKMKISLRFDIE